MKTVSRFAHGQCGSAMLFSLIMLLVMTIIALSSTHTSTLEQRMVAGMADREHAFQAAEIALRSAEEYIESVVSVSTFNGSGGLYGLADDEPDPYDAWTDLNSVQFDSGVDELASQPRYRVKVMAVVTPENKNQSVGRYGQQKKQDPITILRVTARGTGATDAAAAILRSYYGKAF